MHSPSPFLSQWPAPAGLRTGVSSPPHSRIHAATRKFEVMEFANAWVDMESITLSEMSQGEGQIQNDCTHSQDIKEPSMRITPRGMRREGELANGWKLAPSGGGRAVRIEKGPL